MRNNTDARNNSLSETNHSALQREVSTYKQTRIFWPLVAGIAVLFLTSHPFIAFVAYIISGLIYDWFVFKIDRCNDSHVVSSLQLAKEQITSKQYDNLNSFLVKVRQAAFALSVTSTAISLLFFEAANYQFIFVTTYIGISTVAIFWGLESEEIVYPYLVSGETTYPNKQSFENESAAFQRDNFDRLDICSSATYWPGGILDPNRHN